MTRRITVDPAADIDLDEQFHYIASDNVRAAERFVRAAIADFERLAAMPGMGALREFESPDLQDVRSWPIKGFANYLIFYRPTPEGIHVLRVLHGARDINRIFEP